MHYGHHWVIPYITLNPFQLNSIWFNSSFGKWQKQKTYQASKMAFLDSLENIERDISNVNCTPISTSLQHVSCCPDTSDYCRWKSLLSRAVSISHKTFDCLEVSKSPNRMQKWSDCFKTGRFYRQGHCWGTYRISEISNNSKHKDLKIEPKVQINVMFVKSWNNK